MRAPVVVVEADPVCDDPTSMLQGLEAMPMHALLFDRADQSLHQAVLLWRVGRDELLLKSIVSNQCGIATASEDQPLSERSRKEVGTRPQRTEASDQTPAPGPASAVFDRPLRESVLVAGSEVLRNLNRIRLHKHTEICCLLPIYRLLLGKHDNGNTRHLSGAVLSNRGTYL